MVLPNNKTCDFDHVNLSEYNREDEACPTDEELLDRWRYAACPTCLEWWAHRVYYDIRYQKIRARFQNSDWKSYDVEALFQDTVLDMRDYPRHKEIGHAVALFTGILKNKLCKAARQPMEISVDPLDDPRLLATLEKSSFNEKRGIRLEKLAECLDHLSKEKRWLIDARCQGQPVRDIAIEIGVITDTCYKKLSRIRQQLLNCIERGVK